MSGLLREQDFRFPSRCVFFQGDSFCACWVPALRRRSGRLENRRRSLRQEHGVEAEGRVIAEVRKHVSLVRNFGFARYCLIEFLLREQYSRTALDSYGQANSRGSTSPDRWSFKKLAADWSVLPREDRRGCDGLSYPSCPSSRNKCDCELSKIAVYLSGAVVVFEPHLF